MHPMHKFLVASIGQALSNTSLLPILETAGTPLGISHITEAHTQAIYVHT